VVVVAGLVAVDIVVLTVVRLLHFLLSAL